MAKNGVLELNKVKNGPNRAWTGPKRAKNTRTICLRNTCFHILKIFGAYITCWLGSVCTEEKVCLTLQFTKCYWPRVENALVQKLSKVELVCRVSAIKISPTLLPYIDISSVLKFENFKLSVGLLNNSIINRLQIVIRKWLKYIIISFAKNSYLFDFYYMKSKSDFPGLLDKTQTLLVSLWQNQTVPHSLTVHHNVVHIPFTCTSTSSLSLFSSKYSPSSILQIFNRLTFCLFWPWAWTRPPGLWYFGDNRFV